MNTVRSTRLLLMLLFASLGLNFWQFLRAEPAADNNRRQQVVAGLSRQGLPQDRLSGKKSAPMPDEEERNMGLDIDLDVTPGPGALVIGGSVRQTVFERFGRMPGEAFLPITDGSDTVLTDNKVLQPQFTTRESPFVAAGTAGQPCRIPVHTSFGQTFLELTCTPLE